MGSTPNPWGASQAGLRRISQFCLVVAVAALGMKTSFKSLLTLGWRPIMAILFETIFLILWLTPQARNAYLKHLRPQFIAFPAARMVPHGR